MVDSEPGPPQPSPATCEPPASSTGNPALDKKKLKKLNETYARRGVIYISRVPPHLVSTAVGRETGICCVLGNVVACMLVGGVQPLALWRAGSDGAG